MALAINKENFEQLLASGQPVVIDFWAEWCGPCRTMSPIVDELAAEYEGRVVIGKCDVEENDEITMKYGVRNIPTIASQRRGAGGQAGRRLFEGRAEGEDRKTALSRAPQRRFPRAPCRGVLKGDYTALVIPEIGANLVRLCHTGLGAEILRTPAADEIETFRRRPQVFGMPLLFPPNRIADGRYEFDGRTYRFPITIEKEHNYHHGILKSQPFAVSKAWETDEETLVECRYYSNAGNDAVFRDFPHEFKCKLIYRLTPRGMEVEAMFANRSRLPMPVGAGFHTPMRIPFARGAAEDYVMRAAVGEEIELDARKLPTGRRLPLSKRFARLRDEGLQVTGCEPIEAAFTVRGIEVDGREFRGALVENRRSGARTFFEADGQTTSWTLWNNGGEVPYCCPEPQSWTTNAPSAADPAAEGFRSVAPGDKWSMRFRLYAQ